MPLEPTSELYLVRPDCLVQCKILHSLVFFSNILASKSTAAYKIINQGTVDD